MSCDNCGKCDSLCKRVERLEQAAGIAPCDTAFMLEPTPANKRFTPPTPEQVTVYSAAIGWPMNGQDWCDAYKQKGWKVGKSVMKDWQAAVRTWKANGWQPSKAKSSGSLEERFNQF